MLNKFKSFLRTNKYYAKYLQHFVNRVRFDVKNLIFYLRFYKFQSSNEIEGNTVFFILDSDEISSGLADKLKILVCMSYIAEKQGFIFRIIFDKPFRLADYFWENNSKWIGTRNELSFSLKNSRIISYMGFGKFPILKKSVKQYHIYHFYPKNMLDTNKLENSKELWGTNFKKLFKPSERLSDYLSSLSFEPNKYIAVHLRFVNALENFEDGFRNQLKKDKAANLISRCLAGLIVIQNNHSNLPLVVFSDSRLFLNEVKNIYHVVEGKIGHTGIRTKDDEAVFKTFVDFSLIASAKKVYRVFSPEMYETTFSYYAALSNYTELETIHI